MAQVVKKQYVSKGGEWVEVPVGGGGGGPVPNEVFIDPVEPVDPEVELWLDVDEPNTTGGLLDQATADTLYVNVAGDTMTGDLTLNDSNIILSGPTDAFITWPTSDAWIAGSATGSLQTGVLSTGELAPFWIGEPVDPSHAATKGYVDRDTGLLDISAGIFLNGWTGTVIVHRWGNLVEMFVIMTAPNPLNNTATGPPPPGFAGNGTTWIWLNGNGVTAELKVGCHGSTWVNQIVFVPGSGTLTAGDVISGSAMWITWEPWPASLPGTPVTTAELEALFHPGGQP